MPNRSADSFLAPSTNLCCRRVHLLAKEVAVASNARSVHTARENSTRFITIMAASSIIGRLYYRYIIHRGTRRAPVSYSGRTQSLTSGPPFSGIRSPSEASCAQSKIHSPSAKFANVTCKGFQHASRRENTQARFSPETSNGNER